MEKWKKTRFAARHTALTKAGATSAGHRRISTQRDSRLVAPDARSGLDWNQDTLSTGGALPRTARKSESAICADFSPSNRDEDPAVPNSMLPNPEYVNCESHDDVSLRAPDLLSIAGAVMTNCMS